jgi:Bifunctional DNA primase/polymerase, N-terminal/AAA domain
VVWTPNPRTDSNPPTPTAADHARRGWHVFPLHVMNGAGHCTCGKQCGRDAAKHPMTKNGLKDATADVAVVERWSSIFGIHNIGIRTGADSGLVVLDVDGPEGLKQLRAQGPIPRTPTVRTGRGEGHGHLYFKHPGFRVKPVAGILPGLDIRGNDSYVVAPPSVHASGTAYTWAPGLSPDEVELADLPAWVIERLTEPKRTPDAPTADRRYVVGQRGGRIRELFGKLNSEGLPLEVIVQAVLAENEACFDPPKTEAEVRDELDIMWRQYQEENGQGPAKRGGTIIRREPVDPALVGILLSEVEPERVDWLWFGRLARGKVTLIDGDPGRGKSALTVDMAARVTTGRAWPDGQPCEQGGVVICSAEDGLADTIRPRLDAAGGDPTRVVALDLVGEDKHPLTLPDDLSYVEAAVRRVGATVVIVDPLMAYLSGDVNSHRDQDVRRALRPLAEMAERLGVAVVVIRHLNKMSGGPAIYRGGGSIGIIGAARVGLVVGADPDDEDKRVLASVKSNLSAPPASLAYRLVDHQGVVRVQWEGTSELTAEQLVAARVSDAEEQSALADAEGFLRELLADGPVSSAAVKIAARQAGVSDITLRRAKAALGVETHKTGFEKGAGWQWGLPALLLKKTRSRSLPEDEQQRPGMSNYVQVELVAHAVCAHSLTSTVGGVSTCLKCGQEVTR